VRRVEERIAKAGHRFGILVSREKPPALADLQSTATPTRLAVAGFLVLWGEASLAEN
jgi:hypothetical protein